MEYLDRPFAFKAKKVLRYVRLYGVGRTYYKVRGQLHLKKTYSTLPPRKTVVDRRRKIGLIGCGNYAYTTIAYFLQREFGPILAACMDLNIHRAASLAERYRIPVYSADADDVIGHPAVQMVYIASNHATHADHAINALERGKHVYIEKPHAVTEDQLSRLVTAMKKSSGRVFLGFNRPGSRFGRIITEYLNRETGPGMYNWFIAGHDIDPGHWYFKPEEGGRVLGNLCHWTDFVLRLAGPQAFPVVINPTRAAESDCDIAVSFTFADGTIAIITFSAKGHAFEGVKERFSGHKGNCLVTMDDFQTLRVEVIDRKKRFRNVFRDHGHRRNIVAAADNVFRNLPYDRPAQTAHVQDTGYLFLKTKEALERGTAIEIDGCRRRTG
jgi:predicted dehydrogenase